LQKQKEFTENPTHEETQTNTSYTYRSKKKSKSTNPTRFYCNRFREKKLPPASTQIEKTDKDEAGKQQKRI